jgi:hypothetical protein
MAADKRPIENKLFRIQFLPFGCSRDLTIHAIVLPPTGNNFQYCEQFNGKVTRMGTVFLTNSNTIWVQSRGIGASSPRGAHARGRAGRVVAFALCMVATTAIACRADAAPFAKGTMDVTAQTSCVIGIGDTVVPSLRIGADYFILDNLSVGGEINASGLSQDGDNSYGVGLSGVVRHNVLRGDHATLFVDLSFGPMQASSRIPRGGTHFNFITRAGPGLIVPIDDHSHLMLAARYWHLSNAQLEGAGRNPSLNGAELSIGWIWTW